MASLAKELGLAVSPRLDGAVVVPGNGMAARALEELVWRLTFGKRLGNQRQNNYSNDSDAKDCLRCHELSPDFQLLFNSDSPCKINGFDPIDRGFCRFLPVLSNQPATKPTMLKISPIPIAI